MLSELFPRSVLIPPSAVNGSAEFPRRLSIFLPQATVRELPTRSLRGSSLSRWVCRTAPARPDISVCTHRVSQAGVACPRGPLSVHLTAWWLDTHLLLLLRTTCCPCHPRESGTCHFPVFITSRHDRVLRCTEHRSRDRNGGFFKFCNAPKKPSAKCTLNGRLLHKSLHSGALMSWWPSHWPPCHIFCT